MQKAAYDALCMRFFLFLEDEYPNEAVEHIVSKMPSVPPERPSPHGLACPPEAPTPLSIVALDHQMPLQGGS